jgi:YggT family protein
MSDTIRAAILFLVDTTFSLFTFLLFVRLVLAYVGAQYADPVTQLVIRLTDFIVKPLRRWIPNTKGIELSTLLLIFIIEIIKFLVIGLFSFGFPHIMGLPILALADMIKLMSQTFFYAILIQAVMSWIQPQSPMNYLLHQFNSPVMRPIQRLIPPINGIDISPIPAMLLLQLVIIVCVKPLMAVGLGIAFG